MLFTTDKSTFKTTLSKKRSFLTQRNIQKSHRATDESKKVTCAWPTEEVIHHASNNSKVSQKRMIIMEVKREREERSVRDLKNL